MNIVFRVFNDGVAFRYEKRGERIEENTVYRIPEGTKRWMQQWTDAYEGFFPLSTTYKVQPVPSFSGISKSAEGYNNRWGFPALLEPVDGTFVLLTEANIGRGQSAACLYNEGENYRVTPHQLPRGGEQEASPRGGLEGVPPYESHLIQKDLEFVRNVHEIIEKNLQNEDFNVNTLAEEMGLSRSPFFKKLKSLTGFAPVDLVKEIRLTKALSYVETTDMNFTEIAYIVGFRDPGYFTKCFRQKYGKTPKEYRNDLSRK